MLHLLSIEALKLRRNRPFWILLGLYAISLFGINHISSEIFNNQLLELFTFPTVWKDVAYISGFLVVIPGIIVIMHTCAEYTYRTNRQNIIDGLNRKQYVTSKILFVVAISLFSTLIVFLCAFFIGLSSKTTVLFTQIKFIFYFFIQSLVYLTLALMLALFIKKSILTTGIFLLYSMIIENILERRINKIFEIGDLLPLASSDHLITTPYITEFIGEPAHSEYVYLLLSLCYIVLMCFICYYKYEKQDL